MDVMVASDAIGMGLNLNIRRVVFTTLAKPDGRGAPRPIPAPAVKQIAGRAGRRSSAWPTGLAAVLDAADTPRLAAALAASTPDDATRAAGLSPEFEQLEAYAGRHVGASFARILERLADDARLGGRYFFASQTATVEAARLLEAVPGLSLRDRFTFCAAPARARDPAFRRALLAFAAAYADGRPAELALAWSKGAPDAAATGDPARHRPGSAAALKSLKAVEDAHGIVSLWLWLEARFGGGAFPGRADAEARAARLVASIDAHLAALSEAAAAAERKAAARRAAAAAGRGGAVARARRPRAARAASELTAPATAAPAAA